MTENENEEANDYKEKLHELYKCFTSHCANSLQVENFPDECSNVVKIFKNTEISCNPDVADDLQSRSDSTFNYKNALIDDQLQCIKDERMFRNVQIEFLKVYSDYVDVSNKLECLKSEHFLNKNDEENDKKGVVAEGNMHNSLVEIEKCLLEEKKIMDSAKVKLIEERSNIEEEKQYLREEREIFDAERISLIEEKESIAQENKDIVNENLFLNREVATLKKELSNRKASASLEEELKTVTRELKNVKEELKNSLKTNSELHDEISQMLDKVSTNIFATTKSIFF